MWRSAYWKTWQLLLFAGVMLALVTTSVAAQVTVVHLVNGAHGEPFNETMKELADEFNRNRSDIRVELQTVAGNYDDAITTMIAAGVAPDVIHIANNNAARLVPGGFLVDLNQFAERDGINLRQIVAGPALDALTWQGILFGIPIFAQAIAVTYNIPLFDEAGLATPSELHARDEWTWETYLESARRITVDRDGDGAPEQFGTGFAPALNRWVFWVWQAGGVVFDGLFNPKKSFLQSDPVREALEYYTSWGAVHGVVGGSFQSGNQGLYPYALPSASANFQDVTFEWDVVPLARGPVNNMTGLFINNVQLLAASQHPEAAWEWIKYISLNRDAVLRFVGSSGRTPALLGSFDDYLDSISYPQNRFVWLEALNNSRPVALLPQYAQLNRLIAGEINKVVAGTQDVGQMLALLQDQVDGILAAD